jgi:hypothetical protein
MAGNESAFQHWTKKKKHLAAKGSFMKKHIFKWYSCLLSLTFLVVACAGTEITQKPVEDAYRGKPASDILVIAITGNEHNRRIFERRFVAQLKSIGVDAIASEKALPMPGDLELTKEMILEAVHQYENDAVIITHLIGKDEKDTYTRADIDRHRFFGFYRSRYRSAHSPGYSSTSTTVRLETNLYDVETEKRMWSGQSKTWSAEATSQIINDVIKSVVNSLQKNKLIAPK